MRRNAADGALPLISRLLVAIAALTGFSSRALAVEAPASFAVCAVCHPVIPGRTGVGPSLNNIYGRKAGSVDGTYRYSAALSQSMLVWDMKTLKSALTAQGKIIPGSKMCIPTQKRPEDVQAIIAHLIALSPSAKVRSPPFVPQFQATEMNRLDLSDQSDCGISSADDNARRCLAQDLRVSDAQINRRFTLLMQNLDADSGQKLQQEQRDWLKMRNRTCHLTSKETNREKWLFSVLSDPETASCLVRLTNERIKQLEQWGETPEPAKTPERGEAPIVVPENASSWQVRPRTPDDTFRSNSLFNSLTGVRAIGAKSHSRGKWYYEAIIDQYKLASEPDMRLNIGFIAPELLLFRGKSPFFITRQLELKRKEAGMGEIVLGLALDLEGGFVNIRQNGQWREPPGSPGSIVLNPKADWTIAVSGDVDVISLVQRGIINVNTGDTPFVGTIPDGYQAWNMPE